MPVSKKRSPYVKIENRAFQQVYDDLNDVIDSVNQYIDIESSKSVVGDLIPNEDSSYNIGDETKTFKNIYAEKFYGDGSALTGISSSGGGGNGVSTYQALSGIVSVNSSTSADEVLSGDHKFIQFGTLQVNNTITVSDGKTLEFRE